MINIVPVLLLIIGILAFALWYFYLKGEKEEGKYSMPRNRIEIDWQGDASKKGLTGMIAKKVALVAQGRTIPFSKNYIKAYKKNNLAPIFDKTEGRPAPRPKVFGGINPGQLEYEE